MTLFFVILLAAAPADAAQTAWQELAPQTRARLVSSDVLRPDGTTLIGLEIDMPRSTKTYWRIPGESGIAPQFDLDGSSGISGHTLLWPYPTVDTAGGYIDYAYFGPTVLPIALAVGAQTPVVRLTATLGICSEICVPAAATFELPLDFTKADPGQGVRIGQAVAETPISWDQPGEAISTVMLAGEGLEVALGDAAVDPSSLIADTGNPSMLFGTPQKSPDGKSVFLPLLGSGAAGLEGQSIRIIFMTGMGPYEVLRQVSPAKASAGN